MLVKEVTPGDVEGAVRALVRRSSGPMELTVVDVLVLALAYVWAEAAVV